MIQNRLRVFISGKENELTIERKAAIEAINSLGLVFVSSENRTASDKPISDKYTSELLNSNIYVGIFGNIDSIPSREEFNIAKTNGIPTLVFEKRFNSNEVREKSLQVFLTSIKNRFYTGVTVSEFSDVFDLRDKIINSLQQLLFDKFLESKKPAETSQNKSSIKVGILPTSRPHILSISVKSDKTVYPIVAFKGIHESSYTVPICRRTNNF